jgi:hypothetical protein
MPSRSYLPHIETAWSRTTVRRFKTLMWIDIVANIIVAAISVICTESVLDFLHLDPARPLVWPCCVAFLLILLSLFCVPAALDPISHRYSAIVSIVCRFGGVAFFVDCRGSLYRVRII